MINFPDCHVNNCWWYESISLFELKDICICSAAAPDRVEKNCCRSKWSDVVFAAQGALSGRFTHTQSVSSWSSEALGLCLVCLFPQQRVWQAARNTSLRVFSLESSFQKKSSKVNQVKKNPVFFAFVSSSALKVFLFLEPRLSQIDVFLGFNSLWVRSHLM